MAYSAISFIYIYNSINCLQSVEFIAEHVEFSKLYLEYGYKTIDAWKSGYTVNCYSSLVLGCVLLLLIFSIAIQKNWSRLCAIVFTSVAMLIFIYIALNNNPTDYLFIKLLFVLFMCSTIVILNLPSVKRLWLNEKIIIGAKLS